MSKNEGKRIKVKASKLKEVLPELGLKQVVRAGNAVGSDNESTWDIAVVMAEIEARGWDKNAGGIPFFRKGDKSLGDGNRRCTAAYTLSQTKPGLFKDLEIELLEYPAEMSDEDYSEVIARALRSTKAMSKQDFEHHAMNICRSNPHLSQIEKARKIGVNLILQWFPGAFKPEALESDGSGGKKLKAGVNNSAFRNKQGTVQVGEYLAQAHPVAVSMYFSTDPARKLSYSDLLEADAAWTADKKDRPDVAGLQTVSEISTQFPESRLASKLAPIILEGKQTAPGRQAGEQAKMSTKTRIGLAQTFAASQSFCALVNFVNGQTGYIGESCMKDLEILAALVAKFERENAEAAVVVQRIQDRARAEAEQQRLKLAQAEGDAAKDAANGK